MRNRKQLVLPLNLEIKIEKNDPVRDGTKIEANANRYTFVLAKSVEKVKQK